MGMILISLIFLASFLSGCGGEKEKEVVEANKVNESAESQEETEVEADLSQENIEVEAKLHSGKIKKWYLRKRENVETHKVYSSVFLPLIQDGTGNAGTGAKRQGRRGTTRSKKKGNT